METGRGMSQDEGLVEVREGQSKRSARERGLLHGKTHTAHPDFQPCELLTLPFLKQQDV